MGARAAAIYDDAMPARYRNATKNDRPETQSSGYRSGFMTSACAADLNRRA
jgi:hypothetical protein